MSSEAMAGGISTGTFSFIVVAARFVIMYIYSMVNTDVCGQLGIRVFIAWLILMYVFNSGYESLSLYVSKTMIALNVN